VPHYPIASDAIVYQSETAEAAVKKVGTYAFILIARETAGTDLQP